MSEKVLLSESMVKFLLIEKIEEKGLRAFCREHNLDAGNVSNVVNGKRKVQKAMAEAIGLEEITMYQWSE